MKKIIYWMFASMMAVAMTFTVSACSSDDDNDVTDSLSDSALKKILEEEGYTIGSFSWSDLSGVCSFLNEYSAISNKAIAYYENEGSYAFIYTNFTANQISSYCNSAKSDGFTVYENEGYYSLMKDNYLMSIFNENMSEDMSYTVVSVSHIEY